MYHHVILPPYKAFTITIKYQFSIQLGVVLNCQTINCTKHVPYYAYELLSMVYERNACWKTEGEDCNGKDEYDEGSSPVAVNSVTLNIQ